jgi:nucleotide-binding universal stress UspA family protein
MYKRILISVDGSESNRLAVESGLNVAKAFGSEVTAIFVFDIGSYGNIGAGAGIAVDEEYAENVSKAALQYVREQAALKGIELREKMVIGHPAEAIVEESSRHDLVVCGTLGRTGMSRALVGSVAERVVRHSLVPVLVCPKHK